MRNKVILSFLTSILVFFHSLLHSTNLKPPNFSNRSHTTYSVKMFLKLEYGTANIFRDGSQEFLCICEYLIWRTVMHLAGYTDIFIFFDTYSLWIRDRLWLFIRGDLTAVTIHVLADMRADGSPFLLYACGDGDRTNMPTLSPMGTPANIDGLPRSAPLKISNLFQRVSLFHLFVENTPLNIIRKWNSKKKVRNKHVYYPYHNSYRSRFNQLPSFDGAQLPHEHNIISTDTISLRIIE